jgi:hypothetical protein
MFAHEIAGAARTRSSLRPLLRVACALFFLWADEFAKLGRSEPRERGGVSAPVMPAQAGIQYSEVPAMEARPRDVLDTRLRGYDGGRWSIVIDVIARSTCDEAIQLFLVVLDCFATARNDGF